MGQTCKSCRFFHDLAETCHRYPPVFLVRADADAQVLSCWPDVNPDSWCGEHEPNEPPAAPAGGGQ